MALIRPFRNSDTHDLATAWCQHWQAAGMPVMTSSSQLEQAILDKPFFEFDHMLVLEENSRVIGFSHQQTDPSDTPPIRARIASFCVGDAIDREQTARELLNASMKSCSGQGIKHFEVGTILGDLSGLVGLEPFAGVIGMLDHDELVTGLLKETGFVANTPMAAYQLDLTTYRTPADRELLMLRRTAQVKEVDGDLPTDWRAACAHSHFDITTFTITNRAGGELATARYYLSDPEALVMDRGLLYLAAFNGASSTENEIDLSPEIRFSVAGSLPLLAERHFKTVRAIVDSRSPSAPARANFLEELGFQKIATGSSYQTQL